ncbi:NUDIX domain-containing protein [Patescibacteria group bacterium]|nr:NUDIX domain-containing protein [Patescibacteria group bacterium]MCL5091376.1 NUDIX domain-containing protein [Patescibacteria group bacterium]
MPKDNKKEPFVVVDEADKLIGYFDRDLCHHRPDLIHRAVDIVIFDKQKRVMLQKRSRLKDTYPGYYGLSVAGHVKPGETYRQAALREAKEEIGVTLPLKFVTKTIFRNHREGEMTSIYTCQYQGEYRLDKTEVESVDFFLPDQLGKMADKITPGSINTLKILKLIA